MTDKVNNLDRWIECIKPDNFKDNLISCSLFIATYESFKSYLIENLKFFYNTGFDNGQYIFSPKYKQEVLCKDKSKLKASLLWLNEHDAITAEDIEVLEKIRQYRNKIAHEMYNLISDGISNDFLELFSSLVKIEAKIEKWWIINIELPTSCEGNLENIDEENIITSSQIRNYLASSILSNDSKESNYFYNEFIKFKEKASHM